MTTTTAQQAGEQPSEMPEPAFRLKWKDGAYYVNKPNIGDTDCYTADQMRAALSAPHAPQSEPLTAEQVCAEFDALSARMNGWNALGSVNAAWHAFKCGVAFALAARASAGSSRGNHG